MFSHLFMLAWRNLLRHRVRSLIALVTVCTGVISILLAGGFIDWIFWTMRESAIESQLGHIQVTRPQYHQQGRADPFKYLLPEATQSEVWDALSSMPEAVLVTPRLSFNGLVAHGDTTVAFIGEGVDPGKEKQVSRQLHMIQGANLASSDDHGMILGQGLAANLGVSPGDRVVLLANKATGGINAVEAVVRGVFFTASKSFDDIALRVPLALAQNLIGVNGSHVWVVLLHDTEQTASVLARLQQRFPEKTYGVEFTSWYTLAEFYRKTVTLFSRQIMVVKVIIGLIILLTISNTFIMSILERTGEIGTSMALGMRRRQILFQFVSEGILLGVMGGLLGVAIGWPLAEIISLVGIPMPPPPNMDVAFKAEILVTWPLAAFALALAVGTTAIASIYPAWRAARLQIVDALRHSR